MDFHLTPEQRAFKDQVVKFSQKELAPLAEEADWKGEFCWPGTEDHTKCRTEPQREE
jgi:alkylation response protein AidB-like acyl-CoA dehydrogenase